MVEQKQNVTEEMLLKEMERRGAPYAGKPVWNRATEERASAALDLMRECLRREQEASDRGAADGRRPVPVNGAAEDGSLPK